MLADHFETVMKMAARESPRVLSKKFCWETIEPRACPPIKEPSVSFSNYELTPTDVER